ncbi:MAG: insulinase family protein [Acidobacteriia bacterium]|nr:insulinase family protein [Terriglobia bacterium]
MRRLLSSLLAFLFFASVPLLGQDIASLEKRITVRKLPNGLTLLVMERPEAPVFSGYTFVDAGSVQDPKNETGLAHMFEHMAFKGTKTIGTTNWPAEKVALQKVEQAYAAYIYEFELRVGRDDKKVAQLKKAWQDAIKKADKYVVRNAYPQIIEENGGVGMNAQTSDDQTIYFYSFPSNRLQLWAYLESERFLEPVMREFYKERDVVFEERRMSTESNPIGRLFEQFIATAFMAHPYHRPTIGWASDLRRFSATDAERFFHFYYVPANMVVAAVGDIKVAQALPVMEKYFGRLPKAPQPVEDPTLEPQQQAERRVELTETAQPVYIEGYHRPDYRDPDDSVYDAISDIMSNGRTSRLYRSLVRDKKIAADSAGFSGWPGSKYPHLFAFYAVPTPGHTNAEVRDAIRAEIERLKTSDVTDDELAMFKTRATADLIRGLGNNAGLAAQLATFQARFGDWRELFRQLDRYDKVTKADIRRVANKTFVPANRTVGIIESTKMAGAAPAQQPEEKQ